MLTKDIDFQKVISRDSDSMGATRNVYFINDDLVLKEAIGDANEQEWEVYNEFNHLDNTYAMQNGVKFTVRIPKMEYIQGYIIAEKVKFGHLKFCCDFYHNSGSKNRCTYEGDDKCQRHIINAVAGWCEDNMGLYDMHEGNFCWDDETNTAWLVDIAD